jgi:hypothetical protein
LVRLDEVEPKLVTTFTNAGRFNRIQPTIPSLGETLPKGYARSGSGFLLNNNVKVVAVDQSKVQQALEFLHIHAAIAYFVGGKLHPGLLSAWLFLLQEETGTNLDSCRNLGRGFFQIGAK